MAASLKKASIYSVLGPEVLISTSKTIKVSNLENGIYVIKIEDETGVTVIKRFIKNKF